MALVVHGLNTAPAAMLPVVQWLNRQNIAAYLVLLSGHYAGGTPLQNVTASVWQQEVLAGYAAAKKAAGEKAVPLFFVGYSLGGLLGQSVLVLPAHSPPFDRQLLLSPAITLRRRAFLLRALFFLPPSVGLPSFSPPSYRVSTALPLRLYQVLFGEERKMQQADSSRLNIPTLVLMDPNDELISYKRLQKWIQKYHLTNYTVVTLDPDLTGRSKRFHHLILDEATMGKKNWQLATAQWKAFLFPEREE